MLQKRFTLYVTTTYIRADEKVKDGSDGLGVARVDKCDVLEVKDEWRVTLQYQTGVNVRDVRLTTDPVNDGDRRRNCQLRLTCISNSDVNKTENLTVRSRTQTQDRHQHRRFQALSIPSLNRRIRVKPST